MTEATWDVEHASLLLDLKRFDEAAGVLVQVVAAEAADGQAWSLLAAAHLGAGRHREALAAASRATTLGPSDDWPYRLASTAHRCLGNVSAAIATATQACTLAPHEWRAFACLAQAQLATEVDFLAAEQAAAAVLQLAPLEPDAHFTAGQVSYAQERWKAARAHFERALSLDPGHSGALNELGRIKLRRDQPLAARHFIQAVRAEPAVSTYARNVEAAIRHVMALTVRAAIAMGSVFLVLTVAVSASRQAAGIGYPVTIALIEGYAAVQLWRMPPGARPLLRTRRVAVALGVLYGAILIAIITTAITPPRTLPTTMLAATALIIASAFAAGTILRRKQPASPHAK